MCCAHEHSTECIWNVKCTRYGPSKCKYLLSVPVKYASMENQYSGRVRPIRPYGIETGMCAPAWIHTPQGYRWGKVTPPKKTTGATLLAKSLFYDRSAGSMAPSRWQATQAESLERTVTNFNWYHLLDAPRNSGDKWISNEFLWCDSPSTINHGIE